MRYGLETSVMTAREAKESPDKLISKANIVEMGAENTNMSIVDVHAAESRIMRMFISQFQLVWDSEYQDFTAFTLGKWRLFIDTKAAGCVVI